MHGQDAHGFYPRPEFRYSTGKRPCCRLFSFPPPSSTTIHSSSYSLYLATSRSRARCPKTTERSPSSRQRQRRARPSQWPPFRARCEQPPFHSIACNRAWPPELLTVADDCLRGTHVRGATPRTAPWSASGLRCVALPPARLRSRCSAPCSLPPPLVRVETWRMLRVVLPEGDRAGREERAVG